MSAKPEIRAFFDEPTNTVSYLVWDPATCEGAVINPVPGAEVGIGEHIREVQLIFRPVFSADDVSGDGSEFDHLYRDGERSKIGTLEAEVIYTPGHTPACVSYKIGDAVFVGDTLFMPDFGTARADFPGGDAHALYRSIHRPLLLPPETRLFMCHDYKAPGHDQYAWETTVGEERAHNVHVHDGVHEDEFTALRTKRGATFAAPLLLIPSIQVNIRAGKLPPAESNGVRYLKVPVKLVAQTAITQQSKRKEKRERGRSDLALFHINSALWVNDAKYQGALLIEINEVRLGERQKRSHAYWRCQDPADQPHYGGRVALRPRFASQCARAVPTCHCASTGPDFGDVARAAGANGGGVALNRALPRRRLADRFLPCNSSPSSIRAKLLKGSLASAISIVR